VVSIGLVHGLWTLLIFVIFILIVAYVWNRDRRSHFEEAGRIPFDEEDEPPIDRPADNDRS
jgi:cytochrome c oxidase cbb3-type subunit IV